MESLVISAPGKVILHGEHAVVYGKKALAASLNLRTYLRLQVYGKENGRFKISLPDIKIEKELDVADIAKALNHLELCTPTNPKEPSAEVLHSIQKYAAIDENTTDTKKLAVVAVLYLYACICLENGSLPCLEITVSSHLPTGAGLGSSAAFASSLAAALLQQRGVLSCKAGGRWNEKDLELINSWAFQSEKIIHGRPSGIDNAVSTFGEAVTLQTGKISFVKSIPELRILLINTKVPRSTKVLVEGVRQKLNKFPDIISPVLDSIEAISTRCLALFEKMKSDPSAENYQILNDLIEMNQHELCVLGVSHPSLQTVVDTASRHGLSCKLTGAGGGGCAFAVIPPGTEEDTLLKVKREITSLNYTCFETKVGGTGVTLHMNVKSIKLPHETSESGS